MESPHLLPRSAACYHWVCCGWLGFLSKWKGSVLSDRDFVSIPSVSARSMWMTISPMKMKKRIHIPLLKLQVPLCLFFSILIMKGETMVPKEITVWIYRSTTGQRLDVSWYWICNTSIKGFCSVVAWDSSVTRRSLLLLCLLLILDSLLGRAPLSILIKMAG